MKHLLLPLALSLSFTSGLCAAQDMGRVISSTAVIQQIAVPRQVCTTQAVTTSGSKSGAGAVMGAVAGGAIGNAIGDGTGRAVATMLGLFGGAILGDRVEGAGQPETRNVQTCSTQTFYESRTVSYNVVYEYAGKQYSTSMPQDPGPFVKLQISPISAAPPVQVPVMVQTSQTVVQPVVVREVVYAPVAPWMVKRDFHHEHWRAQHRNQLEWSAANGWGDARYGQWR